MRALFSLVGNGVRFVGFWQGVSLGGDCRWGWLVKGRRAGEEPLVWSNAGHIRPCYVELTLGNSHWTVALASNLDGTTRVSEVAVDCLPSLLSPGPLSRSGHSRT